LFGVGAEFFEVFGEGGGREAQKVGGFGEEMGAKDGGGTRGEGFDDGAGDAGNGVEGGGVGLFFLEDADLERDEGGGVGDEGLELGFVFAIWVELAEDGEAAAGEDDLVEVENYGFDHLFLLLEIFC